MTARPEGISWEITLPYACSTTRNNEVAQSVQPIETTANDGYAPSLAGRQFLVVEDEPLIGLDIISALEDNNAEVEGPIGTIGTIEEACDLIERSHFDAALIDANLHGRPVDAIATALSKRNVPFVFVTGYDKDGLPEGFRSIPILSKPCSPEQVVETAARLVSS